MSLKIYLIALYEKMKIMFLNLKLFIWVYIKCNIYQCINDFNSKILTEVSWRKAFSCT